MDNKVDLSIFLVDDDPIYRSIYAHYLQTLGYNNISQFTDGQECINNITQSPDIILLDHEMLPMNGMETLKKIKRYDPNIFVIYLSGQGQMEIAINALKYGAFDYVIKGSANERQRVTEVIAKIIDVREKMNAKKTGKWRRFFLF